MRRLRDLALDGERARRFVEDIGCSLDPPARSALLIPLGSRRRDRLRARARRRGERRLGAEAVEIATLFAAAASAALVQMSVADDHAAPERTPGGAGPGGPDPERSLDLNRVLVRICHEAASILDGDIAVVYRGDGSEGVTVGRC